MESWVNNIPVDLTHGSALILCIVCVCVYCSDEMVETYALFSDARNRPTRCRITLLMDSLFFVSSNVKMNKTANRLVPIVGVGRFVRIVYIVRNTYLQFVTKNACVDEILSEITCISRFFRRRNRRKLNANPTRSDSFLNVARPLISLLTRSTGQRKIFQRVKPYISICPYLLLFGK